MSSFYSININPQVFNINIDSDVISPSYSVKNLGFLCQSYISLDNHISFIIKSCFGQLRDFRRIRLLISKTADITLAYSFIHSRLDYCNSLIYGILIITPSNVCKRFKIQLLTLSLVVSVHHISLWFLYFFISYLLVTVLISRFVASLTVRCLYMNLIILVLCSAFDLILIPFVLPLLAHYY